MQSTLKLFWIRKSEKLIFMLLLSFSGFGLCQTLDMTPEYKKATYMGLAQSIPLIHALNQKHKLDIYNGKFTPLNSAYAINLISAEQDPVVDEILLDIFDFYLGESTGLVFSIPKRGVRMKPLIESRLKSSPRCMGYEKREMAVLRGTSVVCFSRAERDQRLRTLLIDIGKLSPLNQ